MREDFRFSQGSLQDYVDCQRRFQLRYVVNQSWPDVQAEPLMELEAHLERGARFHRLIERHQLGMESSVLETTIGDDEKLLLWWRAYLDFDYLHELEGQRFPELFLSAQVGGYRLVAKYDLVVVVPGERVVIFDWKTGRRRLSRHWFDERMQTRVYPYVMVRSGASLLGAEVLPEQVSMVYWLVADLGVTVVFEYSRRRFLEDEVMLARLMGEIVVRDDGGVWPLVGDDRGCRCCVYRSLCERVVSVADLEEYSNEGDNAAGGVGWFGLGDVVEGGF